MTITKREAIIMIFALIDVAEKCYGNLDDEEKKLGRKLFKNFPTLAFSYADYEWLFKNDKRTKKISSVSE